MNYKNYKNQYEINGDHASVTALKKDGSEVTFQIDAEDVERIKAMGTWFIEWHKDFNAYTVQNITAVKGKKPLKQSLQTFVLNTNPHAPVKHINGDMLDNRKTNLQIVERNQKNQCETVDETTTAIILTDKYGTPHAKALISTMDLKKVVTDSLSWSEYKRNGVISVVANTPEGRIHLDELLMKPEENQTIHHINLNPLDCRRENMELKEIEE